MWINNKENIYQSGIETRLRLTTNVVLFVNPFRRIIAGYIDCQRFCGLTQTLFFKLVNNFSVVAELEDSLFRVKDSKQDARFNPLSAVSAALLHVSF